MASEVIEATLHLAFLIEVRIRNYSFSKKTKSLFPRCFAPRWGIKLQFFPFEVFLQEEAVKYNVDGTRRDCFNTKKDEKYDPKSGRNFNEAERIQKYLQSHVSNFLMLFTTTLRIVRDCVFTYIELHCY